MRPILRRHDIVDQLQPVGEEALKTRLDRITNAAETADGLAEFRRAELTNFFILIIECAVEMSGTMISAVKGDLLGFLQIVGEPGGKLDALLRGQPLSFDRLINHS